MADHAQGSQPAWAAAGNSGGQTAQGNTPSWMPQAPQNPPMHSSQYAGKGNEGQNSDGGNEGNQHQPPQEDPRIEQLQQMLQKQQSESEELRGTIGKLRGALGVEGPEEDPNDDSWYNDILQTAFEYEKQGRGIPVTVDLATRAKKMGDDNAALRKQVDELTRQVQQGLNPDSLHNQRAYESIDNQISNTIEGAYGKVDPGFQKYVASQVAEDVRNLQQHNPELWQRVRSTPSLQQKMIRHHVQQAIPENIRNHMQEEYLRTSPMSKDELAQAYSEADAISKENPELGAELKTKARQMYLETLVNGNKEQSFAGRVRRARGY